MRVRHQMRLLQWTTRRECRQCSARPTETSTTWIGTRKTLKSRSRTRIPTPVIAEKLELSKQSADMFRLFGSLILTRLEFTTMLAKLELESIRVQSNSNFNLIQIRYQSNSNSEQNWNSNCIFKIGIPSPIWIFQFSGYSEIGIPSPIWIFQFSGYSKIGIQLESTKISFQFDSESELEFRPKLKNSELEFQFGSPSPIEKFRLSEFNQNWVSNWIQIFQFSKFSNWNRRKFGGSVQFDSNQSPIWICSWFEFQLVEFDCSRIRGASQILLESNKKCWNIGIQFWLDFQSELSIVTPCFWNG